MTEILVLENPEEKLRRERERLLGELSVYGERLANLEETVSEIRKMIEYYDGAIEALERLKEKEIESDGVSTKGANEFEKISKAISNKKIKIAGFYREKAYIRKKRLLKELQGNGYEYLVRGKHGTLLAYEVKVQKNDDNWGGWHDDYEIIENENFPEIQWTDNEPAKISELLASYENGGENGKL